MRRLFHHFCFDGIINYNSGGNKKIVKVDRRETVFGWMIFVTKPFHGEGVTKMVMNFIIIFIAILLNVVSLMVRL